MNRFVIPKYLLLFELDLPADCRCLIGAFLYRECGRVTSLSSNGAMGPIKLSLPSSPLPEKKGTSYLGQFMDFFIGKPCCYCARKTCTNASRRGGVRDCISYLLQEAANFSLSIEERKAIGFQLAMANAYLEEELALEEMMEEVVGELRENLVLHDERLK